MQAQLTNTAALRRWWDDQPNVFWKIYQGHKTGRKTNVSVISANREIDDRDEAFEKMLNSIQDLTSPGAKVTILTQEEADTNKRVQQVLYTVPSNSQSSINGVQHQNPAIASAGSVQAYVQSEVKKALSDFQKDMEIESLRAQLEEKERPDWKAKIMGSIADNPESAFDKIMGVAMQFLTMKNGNQTPVMVRGTVVEETHTEEEQPEDYNLQERLGVVLQRLSAHREPVLLLEQLADALDANPALLSFVDNYLNTQK